MVTADLTEDNTASALLCTVPDGIPVTFSATGGAVDPEITTTLGGTASTTWTAMFEGGSGSVSAMVDGETATTNTTTITDNTLIFEDDFESGDTSAWSTTVQ